MCTILCHLEINLGEVKDPPRPIRIHIQEGLNAALRMKENYK